MARIRTVKPEFFRHEALQDLELSNPGAYPMMVFQALWGHCDSKGRFEWKPRTLKLDILPFLPFDMAATLAILERAQMIHRYEANGKEYGEIRTFTIHQRLSGKELTEGEKYPDSTGEASERQQGSAGEIPESQEWKGREEEGKRKGNTDPNGSVAGTKAPPICPHQEIIDLYHEILPMGTMVRIWNEQREKHLRARWRENPKRQNLAWWKKFFEYVRESEFLMGRSATQPGRTQFVVSLDWLVNPQNMAKVIEGKYHRDAA